MKKKIKIIFTTLTLVLLTSNVYSAQKDCSVFKHKVDKKICEAQNLENSRNTSSSGSVSESSNKASSFLKKVKSKFSLKNKELFRKQGDPK